MLALTELHNTFLRPPISSTVATLGRDHFKVCMERRNEYSNQYLNNWNLIKIQFIGNYKYSVQIFCPTFAFGSRHVVIPQQSTFSRCGENTTQWTE